MRKQINRLVSMVNSKKTLLTIILIFSLIQTPYSARSSNYQSTSPLGTEICTKLCGYEAYGGSYYKAMCWPFSKGVVTLNTPGGTKTWVHLLKGTTVAKNTSTILTLDVSVFK